MVVTVSLLEDSMRFGCWECFTSLTDERIGADCFMFLLADDLTG